MEYTTWSAGCGLKSVWGSVYSRGVTLSAGANLWGNPLITCQTSWGGSLWASYKRDLLAFAGGSLSKALSKFGCKGSVTISATARFSTKNPSLTVSGSAYAGCITKKKWLGEWGASVSGGVTGRFGSSLSASAHISGKICAGFCASKTLRVTLR